MKAALPLLLALALAACGGPGASSAAAGQQGALDGSIAMPVPRAAHGALALADGRVALFGGCVAESCEAGPDSATVDAYDPSSGRIERAGTLLDRRVSAALLPLASGEVVLAGGWVGSHVTAATEIWNPATGRSRRGPPLGLARADLAAIALRDGRWLLAGGYDGRGPVDSVEIYDSARGTLSPAGRLAVARAGAGAARLPDGRVLIVGGLAENGPTATAEIFDASTGRSAATGALAGVRYKHSVATLRDGRIFVFGGSDRRDNDGKTTLVERFEPGRGTFAAAGRLIEPRYKIGGAVVALSDGRVLVAGGAKRAELYDPAIGRSFAVGPDFGASLNFATATPIADGSVLVAGGYAEEGIRMNARAWRLRPPEG